MAELAANFLLVLNVLLESSYYAHIFQLYSPFLQRECQFLSVLVLKNVHLTCRMARVVWESKTWFQVERIEVKLTKMTFMCIRTYSL